MTPNTAAAGLSARRRPRDEGAASPKGRAAYRVGLPVAPI